MNTELAETLDPSTLPTATEAAALGALRGPDMKALDFKTMWNVSGIISRGPACPNEVRKLVNDRSIDARMAQEWVFTLVLMGQEFGFTPLIAVKLFTIIKGQIAATIHCMSSLVQRSGRLERLEDPVYTGTVEGRDRACTIRVKRCGQLPSTATFSYQDAADMKLLYEKSNWWKQFDVMLEHRCRSKLYRRVFADVLNGIYIETEVHEFEDRKTIGETQVVTQVAQAAEQPRAALPPAQPRQTVPPARTPEPTVKATPMASQGPQTAPLKVAPVPAADPLSERLDAFKARLTALKVHELEMDDVLAEASSFRGTKAYVEARRAWAERKRVAAAEQSAEARAAFTDEAPPYLDEPPVMDDEEAVARFGPGARG